MITEYECCVGHAIFKIEEKWGEGNRLQCPICHSENIRYTRRIKRYAINEQLMWIPLFDGCKNECYIEKGIPKGSTILGVSHDSMSNAVYVFVWNINFDVVDEGDIPPTDHIIMSIKEIE